MPFSSFCIAPSTAATAPFSISGSSSPGSRVPTLGWTSITLAMWKSQQPPYGSLETQINSTDSCNAPFQDSKSTLSLWQAKDGPLRLNYFGLVLWRSFLWSPSLCPRLSQWLLSCGRASQSKPGSRSEHRGRCSQCRRHASKERCPGQQSPGGESEELEEPGGWRNVSQRIQNSAVPAGRRLLPMLHLYALQHPQI